MKTNKKLVTQGKNVDGFPVAKVEELKKCEHCEEEYVFLQMCGSCNEEICDSCYKNLDGGSNWKFCPHCAGGTIYKQ